MHTMLIAKLLSCAAILASATIAAGQEKPVDGRFDVGGRSIRLSCTGSGGPTVVIDAGMGTAPVEDPGWRGIAD